MTLHALQIIHLISALHLISKYLKNSTLCANQAEYDFLNKVEYASTQDYAKLFMNTISSNALLMERWRTH